METSEKIGGIYYERKVLQMGTAGTHKVSNDFHDLHYFAKDNAKGEVDICYLKPDGTPSAIVAESIAREAFAVRFKDCGTHECDLRKKTPEEKKAEIVDAKVRKGEEHLEKKEFNSATFEFGQALKADDKRLDAHLGKGQAHLALGEVDKAKEHFEKMAAIDGLYGEDNKHTLNELGITLRRSGMFEEAIRNYQKASLMDPADEALHFNMGRAYKEWGKTAEAREAVQKALAIKPDFQEALDLLKTLQ